MTSLLRPIGGPVLVWLEVRGFRSFGTEARHLDLDAPLSVVHAPNSQGKSSLAEAFEFLLTGRSSRRDLLGGAKAEYHESLRNVHLPAGNQEVWIAVGLRGSDGQVHEVRRELIHDFAQGAECESSLLVDGVPQRDLAAFGLAPAVGSTLGAPVLLQHTLRHVLSTEPKQRVAYFKSLLALNDLDALRERVTQARRRLASQPASAAKRLFVSLGSTPFHEVAALLRSTVPTTEEDTTRLVNDALLTAGTRALGQRPTDLTSLTTDLQAAVGRQREAVFPLAAFTGSPAPGEVTPVDLTEYVAALAQADREAAALAPIFIAVLAVPAITEAGHPVDCPACATPAALTPARLAALRDELRRGATVESAAQAALAGIRASSTATARTLKQALAAVPAVGYWTPKEVGRAREQMVALGLGETLLNNAGGAASQVRTAAAAVETAGQALQAALTTNVQHVSERADPDESASSAALQQLNVALAALREASRNSHGAANALQETIEPAVSARTAEAGLSELLEAARHAGALAVELRHATARSAADARLGDAEKALATASGSVLDSRFDQMSESITRWWLTIRPEELVGFAGVQRRAGGATFVNLRASLRTDPASKAVERPALGVFSDSQLNALGLATFLARTELLRTPLVVLDDPIPGSDGDHRLTFAQNTVEALLDAGIQVILTTFDDKLARLAAGQQAGRDQRTFELTLSDHVAGTEPTLTSNAFDQLLLEAEDNVNAPTAKGRRAACTTYRTAAERLAKQIIATARTTDGTPTSIGDVEKEAKLLRDLVPLVKAVALDNSERGNWTNFASVLNPGSHDDDLPSNTDLRQIRGNLRKISRNHRKHWANGLVQ